MDYRKYYKKASKEADKIQARLELGKSVRKKEDSLVSRPDDKEAEEIEEEFNFNAAEYMARFRMSAKTTEQTKPSNTQKVKEKLEKMEKEEDGPESA